METGKAAVRMFWTLKGSGPFVLDSERQRSVCFGL
jgi:hypothetical protein